MTKSLLSLFFASSFLFSVSQTWEAVGGNILGNDIHGLGIWNNQLVLGGSFNNNPCDKIATFDSLNWSCPNGGIGTVVRAVTTYNGNLVAVGDFWNNSQPCTNCNGVAMWNGTSWTNLGTGFNNDVLCLTVWNGNLVAGGDFTTADGNTCYRVAMWDGSTWSAIGGLDTAFNNDVRALAVYNGELWVGGDFSNANGCSPCDRIVKWNGTAWVGGNSGVDIAGGLDSTVRVLYVDPVANRLYMGGHFIEANGDPNMAGVAYYDGSVWYPLGTGVNSYVRGITRYNGNIIVGGDFTAAGAVAATRVGKWNPATNTWSTMSTGMDAYLRALIEYKGELYAGGSFHNAGGQTRDYIAKWYEAPIAPPVANFSVSDNSICLGQCVNFTDLSAGTPTSWSWSFPGGTPNSSTLQTPPTVCYSTGGTKTVTLQACNANGCNTYTLSITVSSSPPPSVTLSGNTTICNGQSTTLSASGANSYSWSPSTGLSATTGASVVATPTSTVKYYVTGTTTGCTDLDSIQITVSPTPTVAVTPTTISICPSNSAALSASGATTYSWAPSTGLSSINTATTSASPASTTTYTVTGTTGVCTSTATVTVAIGTTSALPLVEGFETLPFAPLNWSINDGGSDGNIWQHNTSVGGFGTSSSSTWFPNNSVNAPGTKDELRTTRYDFSSSTTAKMFFDVAYCRKSNATFSDTLVVYASTDCGQTWNQIYSKGGSTLATAPNQNGTFTPTSAQWRTDTVYLNSYVGQPGVMFAFQNRNYNGNNLYLDNINISGTSTVPPVAAMSISNDTMCAGTCMTVNDNSTFAPTSWSWTFAGATPSTSTLQNPGSVCYSAPGTYTISLQACNANGCNTTSKVITVLQPVANAGADANVCNGTSTALNGSGGVSYSWSPTTSLFCPTCASTSAAPTSNITYTLTVTDAFGCTSTDDVAVTVVQANAVAGTDMTLCNGSTVQLNGSGGVSYSWSPAASLSCSTCAAPTSSATSTTTYTLIVTDANGCIDIDDVVVTVAPLPVALAGSDVTLCNGSSIQLNGSGGTSYSWSPATSLSCSTCFNPSSSATSTTTYTLTVTDANGCTGTDDVIVTVVQPPVAMAGNDTTICEGETVQLNGSGGVTYSWSPSADLSCASCSNPIASPTVTTTYSVTVSDANNCSATDAINVTVDPCLGISSVGANEFAVFPNPANAEVTIVSSEVMKELALRNLLGETIIRKPENAKQSTLDLSGLASGVYIIQIKTASGINIKRILIER